MAAALDRGRRLLDLLPGGPVRRRHALGMLGLGALALSGRLALERRQARRVAAEAVAEPTWLADIEPDDLAG